MATSNTLLDHSAAQTHTKNFDIDVTNQNNAFWVPEIYSKNVLIAFRKAAVAEAICNTDYFGEIAQYGDTVNVIKEPDITTTAYTRGKAVSAGTLTDEELVLAIDQAHSFAFQVDDLERRFSHVNWQALAANRAAYKLRDTMDSNVLSAMVSGSSTNVIGADNIDSTQTTNLDQTTTSIDMGTSEVDPLDLMARMARKLDDNDVPEEGRWIVAAPQFYEELSKVASKLMSADYNQGNGGLRNGLVASGTIRGFSLYKSRNLPTTTNSTGVLLGGHMSSTACASDLTKVETIRSDQTFADIVRGLLVWGRKVIRAESLVKAYYTID